MDNETITVECRSAVNFEDGDFREGFNKLNEWIVLPTDIFRKLKTFPSEESVCSEIDVNFCYIKVRSTDSTNSGTNSWKSVPAVPFKENQQTDFTDFEHPPACVSTSLQDSIGVSMDQHKSILEIRAYNGVSPAAFVAVRQPKFHSETSQFTCYLNSDSLSNSNLNEEPLVEVVNPELAGRVILQAKELNYLQEDTITINNTVRSLLDVPPGDEYSDEDLHESCIQLFESEGTSPPSILLEPLWRFFVDYNRTKLLVSTGLDDDEDRNIARVHKSTMEFLGVESGDKIVIEWKGNSRKVRCLPIPENHAWREEVEGSEIKKRNLILLPSTERDELNVNVNDIIDSRRSMSYIFIDRIVISVFSAVAGLIAGTSVLRTLLDSISISYPIIILSTISLVVLMISIIWISFWPERQKCRVG